MADGNSPEVLEGLIGVVVECGRSLVRGELDYMERSAPC